MPTTCLAPNFVVSQLKSVFDGRIAPMAKPIAGGGKRIDGSDGRINKPAAKRHLQRERQRIEKRSRRQPSKSKTNASNDGQTSVDASTLKGKVMVGYQGWFNCEHDGSKLGWKHWARRARQPFGPGNVTVDLWPDVSELDADERFVTGFTHADGSAAEVFSSANKKTVMRHFQWMREYGIDGAFVQRFANQLSRPLNSSNVDRVLSHVRAGAGKHGRAFAVMYDLSGLKAGQVQRVRNDWSRLRLELQITQDPTYLHHRGKPLVAVWGIGFNDGRDYTPQECLELVTWLKSDGCAVMLGVPSFWREGIRDAIDDPLLHQTIELADVVSPLVGWSISRCKDSGTPCFERVETRPAVVFSPGDRFSSGRISRV